MPRDSHKQPRFDQTWRRTSLIDTLGQQLQKVWGWYVTILVVLAGAIITSGPNLFLFQLAAQYPFLWVVYGVITLLALSGLGLIIWEWRRVHPTTQRVQYLDAVKEAYQVIPLVIDAETAKKYQVELPKEVYQTLRYLNRPERPADELRATTATSDTIRISTIVDFFARDADAYHTLVILGMPGGGKTTLLRQSMLAAAEAALRSATPVPIYIELPNFARFLEEDEAHAFQRYLEQRPELKGIEGYAAQLEQLALAGQAYLFLDGLDEVAPLPRERVIQRLKQIQQILVTQRSPYSALIVSTRFTVYSPDDLLPQKTELVAQQMDDGERRALAAGLFPALYAQIQAQEPGRAQRLLAQHPDSLVFARQFVAAIAAHQQHDLLGGNPLLFSLSAYVYVDDGGELPASRVLLYQRYITAFLRKVVTLRRQNEAADLRMADKDALLAEIVTTLAGVARWLFEQGTRATLIAAATAGQVSPTAAREFVKADIMAALEQVRADHTWTYRPADMITWVLESGLFATLNADQGRYQFQHQTYQEYLTAVALAEALLATTPDVRQRAWDTLQQRRFDPRWSEPLSMLAGALVAKSRPLAPQGRETARDWLARLWTTARDPNDPNGDDALLLAVVSLADIPDFAAFGEEIAAKAMLDAWAATLLRLAQTPTDARFDRFQRASEKVALLPATFTEPAILRLQGALSDDVYPEQQIAAALAVAGMGNLVTDLAPLTRLVEHGTHEAARIKAARALIKLKRYDANATPPEYYPGQAFIANMLRRDGGPVALLVAQALVESGSDAQPLLPLVFAHADPPMRRWGAIALGGVGSAAAQTQLEHLTHDPVAVVAATALHVFTRLQGAALPLPLADLQRIASQGVDVSSTLRAYLPASLRQLGYQSRLLNGVVVITPPMAEIPAGAFLMGSDKQRDSDAFDHELPQHPVSLDTYWIAQHPLTVAEYACFLDATGHRRPDDWDAQWQHPDHPVVYMSWEDTQAYVAWVAQVTEEPWGMPSEAQWEKAARGTEGRIYPWGDQWDKLRANTGDGGPGATTPVGSYPTGTSPYGVYDMAGNVWEWTSSVFQPYPYVATDGREDPSSQGGRVLRGGSWVSTPWVARAAFRDSDGITGFVDYVGARVVCGVRPRSQ